MLHQMLCLIGYMIFWEWHSLPFYKVNCVCGIMSLVVMMHEWSTLPTHLKYCQLNNLHYWFPLNIGSFGNKETKWGKMPSPCMRSSCKLSAIRPFLFNFKPELMSGKLQIHNAWQDLATAWPNLLKHSINLWISRFHGWFGSWTISH